MRLPFFFFVVAACGPTHLVPDGADDGAGLLSALPTVDCGTVPTDVQMRWSSCASSTDCWVSGGKRWLATPTTGPVVMEAHLVTHEDGISGWPSWSRDRLDDHYHLSESLTGYVVNRTEAWAPAGEGGSLWGQGSTGAKIPADAEAWYITMNWSSRPAPGTPMIVRHPDSGRVVVAAAGYETGPGANTSVAGVAEEVHRWFGTAHLDDLEIGFAADPTLPFGPVHCDGETTGTTTTGGTTGGTPPTTSSEACYLGADRAGAECLAVAPTVLTGDYDYPSPLSGQYAEPESWLVLADDDPDTKLAPNFALREVAQDWKGPYAVVQTHAIAHLQDLRDDLGPLVVNSGYRPPDDNAAVGGATWSRHMYGDAFDLDPSWASLGDLADACYAEGAGYVSVYTNHVHCDWRDDALDPAFYGGHRSAPHVSELPVLASNVVRLADGLTAPAEGWDEGEPLREWTAYDAEGNVLLEAIGARFVPPADTDRVRVVVGRALEREWRP